MYSLFTPRFVYNSLTRLINCSEKTDGMRKENMVLSTLRLSRGLGRVAKFVSFINWHYHRKDHVKISHLDQVWCLGRITTKLWILKQSSKSTQKYLIWRRRPPKPYKLFCYPCKILSDRYHFKETELKITTFINFKYITEIRKKF